MIEPAYLTTMADGTIKQVNPFTGTRVWTVPGRGNRPVAVAAPPPEPLDPAELGRACAFCEQRYLESPPEKSRVIRAGAGWAQLDRLPVERLFDTVAEFRVVPNLFEILSYDYWHANYGYQLPPEVAEQRRAYLSTPAGREHVATVQAAKLKASGRSQVQIDALGQDQILAQATSFFGSGHDVIIARRHWIDGAEDTSELASAGTLTRDEHAQYIRLSVDTLRRLYEANRYARYVAVFQNWLRPAGASFDHLHKQLVGIDEHGANLDMTIIRARENPNLFNEVGVNYASYRNLLIAENDCAIAYAGFGHRYPTVEIYSKATHGQPWRQSPYEVEQMSDLIHAIHAATGSDVATNEEWHHQPIDTDVRMPWRVNIKWRVSTVAGFEGDTKVYVNTIGPVQLRDRIVPRLFELRDQGGIANLRIATECSGTPNLLRYNTNLGR
jgi:galactose-1-phosphate uridylyltransferase